MNTVLIVALIIAGLVFAVFAWTICRAAGIADERERAMFEKSEQFIGCTHKTSARSIR